MNKNEQILIKCGEVELTGGLTIPGDAHGIVIFAHGKGSGRLSPRNLHVAAALQEEGIGTLLFDLLLPGETLDPCNAEERSLLAKRLSLVTEWIAEKSSLPLAYYGASMGAALVFICAAKRHPRIRAVVSRGGFGNYAGSAIEQIEVPTLLIVGGADPQIHSLNQEVFARLRSPKELCMIPGANHFFDQEGALDRVAQVSGEWFKNSFNLMNV